MIFEFRPDRIHWILTNFGKMREFVNPSSKPPFNSHSATIARSLQYSRWEVESWHDDHDPKHERICCRHAVLFHLKTMYRDRVSQYNWGSRCNPPMSFLRSFFMKFLRLIGKKIIFSLTVNLLVYSSLIIFKIKFTFWWQLSLFWYRKVDLVSKNMKGL
jgi:hypothetical protein